MDNLQKYIFLKLFFALGTKIECAEFELCDFHIVWPQTSQYTQKYQFTRVILPFYGQFTKIYI